MAKPCKWCSSLEHTQFYCYKKPRTPIRKKGKKAKKWDKAKITWFELNPPDEYGMWYCIVGGSGLTRDSSYSTYLLNIDHDISRARDSTKVDEQSNLNPICPKHNRLKGSKSLIEYMQGEFDSCCGNF